MHILYIYFLKKKLSIFIIKILSANAVDFNSYPPEISALSLKADLLPF